MLSIIGLFIILSIVVLFLMGKVSPVVGLTIVPLVGALLLGFGLTEIGEFFTEGLGSVINVAIMFIFAILFFGIMRDAGLFKPFINRLVKITRGNIIAICVITVIIAMSTSLDGSAASTFLITIPALLPLYQRLKMSPYLLMLLTASGIGILNMLPWGGPIGRAAAVIDSSPVGLWRPLFPLQLTGVFVLIVMAVILGVREKKRIEKSQNTTENLESTSQFANGDFSSVMNSDNDSLSIERPRLIWLNALLTLAVIVVLFMDVMPEGYVFMIGVAIALLMNYPKVDDQMERIKTHANSALSMAAIIFAAGSFLGIMQESGMLNAIATDIVTILPNFMVPYLHVIIGFFGVPLQLGFTTDAYYFALLPVVEGIVSSYGVAPESAAYALAIGDNIGTMLSPFAPALWLGIGLSGVEIGKHIRYSIFWIWGFSTVLFVIAILIGIITF